jgi:hypothetical protein
LEKYCKFSDAVRRFSSVFFEALRKSSIGPEHIASMGENKEAMWGVLGNLARRGSRSAHPHNLDELPTQFTMIEAAESDVR